VGQVAVDKGLPVMMQLLVSKGALLDRENHQGDTALLAATRTNQTAIMSILLDAGADVNMETRAGLTPLIQVRIPIHVCTQVRCGACAALSA
jgi:ankyrin repeat protein